MVQDLFNVALSDLGFHSGKKEVSYVNKVMLGLILLLSKTNLSKLNFFLESLSIQKITPLINAAKKHHTEVRYCVKKNSVIRADRATKKPRR